MGHEKWFVGMPPNCREVSEEYVQEWAKAHPIKSEESPPTPEEVSKMRKFKVGDEVIVAPLRVFGNVERCGTVVRTGPDWNEQEPFWYWVKVNGFGTMSGPIKESELTPRLTSAHIDKAVQMARTLLTPSAFKSEMDQIVSKYRGRKDEIEMIEHDSLQLCLKTLEALGYDIDVPKYYFE